MLVEAQCHAIADHISLTLPLLCLNTIINSWMYGFPLACIIHACSLYMHVTYGTCSGQGVWKLFQLNHSPSVGRHRFNDIHDIIIMALYEVSLI